MSRSHHSHPGSVPPTVVVLGAGTSGASAARALLAAGAEAVRVLDSRDTPALQRTAEGLRAAGAQVRLGVDDPAAVAGAEVVVTSPGLPLRHPLLAAALETRAPVWSEPELAWRLNGGRTRLAAVTGTNGKTTTTELLAGCLQAPAVGNIGPPLCDTLASPDPPALAVAELSSFQLRFADALHCEVGVLVNVAPDHLDWHPDLADYEAAKARVWGHQTEQDAAVVFVDDPGAERVSRQHPPGGRLVPVSLGPPPAGGLGVARGHLVSRIPGRDGEVIALDALGSDQPAFTADAACAAAAALASGATGPPGAAPTPLTAAEVGARLGAGRPGPHRLERVGMVGGVTYINDSKATNPHAAAAALAAFDSLVWVAGGLNKGLDLAVVEGLLGQRARAVVTVGQAGDEIAAVADAAGVPVVAAGTVAAAVPAAARLARPGDVVLLSPACASMDQFRDYAERGDAFRAAVGDLATGDVDPAAPTHGGARGGDDGG